MQCASHGPPECTWQLAFEWGKPWCTKSQFHHSKQANVFFCHLESKKSECFKAANTPQKSQNVPHHHPQPLEKSPHPIWWIMKLPPCPRHAHNGPKTAKNSQKQPKTAKNVNASTECGFLALKMPMGCHVGHACKVSRAASKKN